MRNGQHKTAVFANRVKLMGTEAAFGFGSRILEVEKSDGERVIRANLGQPDFPLPEHIAEAVIKAIRDGQTTYCDPQGLPELRKALAEKIAADRGLPEIDPERVVVYPGARPSIGFAQQSYCENGDEIIYPSPGYPLYESYIPYVGARPVPGRPAWRPAADHALRLGGRADLLADDRGTGAADQRFHQADLPELPFQSDRRCGHARTVPGIG